MIRLIVLLSICLCSSLCASAQLRSRDRGADGTRLGGIGPDPRSLYWVEEKPPKGWVSEFRPNSEEKLLLTVDPEDQQKFAEILAQPDTGMFRLLPFYPSRRVVSVDDPEASRRPGFGNFASSYSFTKKKHGVAVNGWANADWGWAELKLRDGIVSAGFMRSAIGIIVRLGDLPLESVGLQTPGVAELANYNPPADYDSASIALRNAAIGVQMNGFIFRSRMPATLNITYALRSTMNGRADVLVCFRVVRRDDDGGLTILWKKLREYPKPHWKKIETRQVNNR
jgi:hypothetical protein